MSNSQILLTVLAVAVLTGLGVLLLAMRRPRAEIAERIEKALREETARLRAEDEARGRQLREEVGAQITRFGDSLRAGIEANRAALDARLEAFAQTQNEAADRLRFEIRQSVAAFGEGLAALTRGGTEAQDKLRGTIEERLEIMRKDNETKLEQMRATVEEKLQGTLEKRLGESFALVSERLENVHKGLGEMQNLAAGVGDLKRVLTNVKTRGSWAEAQLGTLLADMLAPDQFAENVEVVAGSNQRVEYAVRLPGQGDNGPVWLPIDCKFPREAYERLMAAQDIADAGLVEEAGRALEQGVRIEARRIQSKYIAPPATTDFALLYLPTEGLFAEVVRRGGLMAELQQSQRIILVGPTTLAALLSSLQMGFRTLAIQQRSSEVWRVLGEAKAEFEKYGQVWDKLAKQLASAQNTAEEAGKRTRAVARKLKDVETIEIQAGAVLPLIALDDDTEAA